MATSTAYKPTYYSAIHHSLSSIYKSIFKSGRRKLLPADEQRQQSEALKWQQEQFHKMLHLTALHREGIVEEAEVSAFRARLLESIAAAPAAQEPPRIVRDKLLFLQELLHSKCISSEEYHTFKRPLLQRLAVLGEEINPQDIKVGNSESVVPTQEATRTATQETAARKDEEEEWSVIDLQDPVPENHPPPKAKQKKNPIKQLIKPYNYKSSKSKDKNKENIVVLVPENDTEPSNLASEKGKRRERDNNGEKIRGWGLDGFKKWRKTAGGQEEEGTAPCLDRFERSDFLFDNTPNAVAADKALGDNIKKELSWIKTELSASNRKNIQYTDQNVETISTKLPTDKSDLNSYFPKAWCERHGDSVLQVVQKELQERAIESSTRANLEPVVDNDSKVTNTTDGYSKDWVSFDDDSENFHPNLFAKGNNANPFL